MNKTELLKWLEHNFPNRHPDEQLLGLVEEVGELCHAQLKGRQGVRHTAAQIRELKIDAVGDILIFLHNYCLCEGIDIDAALETTWEKVAQRDYRTDPDLNGSRQ